MSVFPLTFEVIGLPTGQGSKRAFMAGGRAHMRETGGKAAVAWRDSVARTAKDVADADDVPAPLDGALHLLVEFRFPMPASRPKSVRLQGECPKTTAPDLDKLVRSVCDGLTASGLIHDDARISGISATKQEVIGWTGAVVTLSPYPPTTQEKL